MALPRVILKQKGNIDGFKIIHSPTSNRKIDPALEEKVGSIWEQLKKEYAAKGVRVWDGTYYRLENVNEVANGEKTLKLSTIKFSTLRAYKILCRENEIREEQYTNFISSGAMIETTDHYFVFGKRGKNIHDDNIDILGGGLLESENIANSGYDIEKNVRKEMHEEGHIEDEDMDECELLGILHSLSMNVLFIFKAKLNLSKQQLQDKFKTREDDEMSELVFVEAGKIEEYLKSLPSYRPMMWNLMV